MKLIFIIIYKYIVKHMVCLSSQRSNMNYKERTGICVSSSFFAKEDLFSTNRFKNKLYWGLKELSNLFLFEKHFYVFN